MAKICDLSNMEMSCWICIICFSQESSVVGKPGLSWITRRLFLVRHGAYDKSGPKQGHLNKVG